MQQTTLFRSPKLRGNFRWLLCAVLLFGVAPLVTQLAPGRFRQTPVAGNQAAGEQSALPALQGEAAVERLKQQGLYDSLGQAVQATRYGVRWTEQANLPGAQGAYAAANPAQQFHAYFTPSGLSLETAGGAAQGWRVAMELSGVGYGSRLTAVSAGEVKAAGSRVEIHRRLSGGQATTDQSAITEWYENRPAGLEQGFTLAAAPGERRAGERLRLAMKLAGGLRPRLTAQGEAVALVDKGGREALRYDHLASYDATGRALTARLAVTGDEVWLEVEDEVAVYPVTIDPTITQQVYLKASNTEADDRFGFSVAISGETVVVGAICEDSSATGVNGNQSDNSTGCSGAAYVFVRSGTSWSQQAYLKASNTGGRFGFSVAISGETVVVGAPGEDSNATGVNGDQSDNSTSGSGAAYVFVRSGTTWGQQAYLKASNTEAQDDFGRSVAISGETVVVGALFEDSNATGVNGDQSNNSAFASGAAYVFVRSGTSWSQQAYLKASNTEANDFFGHSVAISGETVVVGAFLEASNATGVNGDQSDNSASFSGAAYIFVRSGTSWSQQAYLKASNTEAHDQFGHSVAISGETVVVGAIVESSSATGVNGDQSDNSASLSGAAYVFVRSGTSWSQQAYLKASNTEASDRFGLPVAISGETVVVGAYTEDSNATGVNSDQSDNSASGSGAAYVFVRSGTTWSQQAYLKASNTEVNDEFGWSVAISGETVVVGAPGEDSNASGGNGNQSDNSARDSGAAYVFTIPNTLPGTNVAVQSGGTTITFDNVFTAGTTTVTPIDPDSAGSIPGGFALTDPPLAFEIQTTATVTGPITICFYVPSVNDPGEFSSLRVLHNEDGTLVDRTILAPDSPAPDFATRTICARVSSLSPFVITRLVNPPPAFKLFYLHGAGPNNNPPTLFLNDIAPTATTAKFKDSLGLSRNGGNPWKDIGTWPAPPALVAGSITALRELHVWLGLKNSDDQGTNFDLRVEVYKNSMLVSSGETYCIDGVTRNANLAKETIVVFAPFSPVAFNGITDGLSLKVLTRIGTNGAGGSCGGHSNATGLRLYFGAVSRPSKFGATF